MCINKVPIIYNEIQSAPFILFFPLLQVARLVQWLLTSDPVHRPTATEVLRSELLPPTVGEEQLEDMLRSLPDNPGAHTRVLDRLFAMGSGVEGGTGVLGAGPGGDPQQAAGQPMPERHPPEIKQKVLTALQGAFTRHGAVPMNSWEIGPPGPTTRHAVPVLSRSGNSLALRSELRRPFAVWVARQAAAGSMGLIDGLRRCEIAQVHVHTRGAALPKPLTLADFDIIWPALAAQPKPVAEAEVVCVMVDAISSLPEVGARWEVRLSHRALADAAMSNAGISRDLRPAALQLLTSAVNCSPLHTDARAKKWPAMRAGLEGLGVARESIDRCKRFVLQGAGDAPSALHWLETALFQHGDKRPGSIPAAALQDLKALLPLLSTLGVPVSRVAVDPFMPPQADYLDGLLLQLHVVNEDTGASSTIGVGGRYDGLLKACWARQTALSGVDTLPFAVCGVGVTINVGRLVGELAAHEAPHATRPPHATGLWRLSNSEALVCSRGGGGLLMERMQLLRTLWDAAIPAETLPLVAPSMQEQYGFASSRNIPWLVIISKASFSG